MTDSYDLLQFELNELKLRVEALESWGSSPQHTAPETAPSKFDDPSTESAERVDNESTRPLPQSVMDPSGDESPHRELPDISYGWTGGQRRTQ
jgi:hypothetical protein